VAVSIVVVGKGVVRWDDVELAVACIGRSDDSVSSSELVVPSHV
jgi:hypothetical protein